MCLKYSKAIHSEESNHIMDSVILTHYWKKHDEDCDESASAVPKCRLDVILKPGISDITPTNVKYMFTKNQMINEHTTIIRA